MTVEDLAKANAINEKVVDLKREVEALRNPTSEIRIVGRAFGCSATSKSVIDEIVAVMLKHKEQMLQEYTKLFEEI